VATRILHVSDLHLGARGVFAEYALGPLADVVAPELVIASGDLAHRGRREQHERAAALLRALGKPLLVVPGNHDIAYTPWARIIRPFAEYEREWGPRQPVYRSDNIVAVGLNSVRPWRHQSGAVRTPQLTYAAEILSSVDGNPLRVAVLHHHMLGAPWRSRKRPVARRNHVLASLVDAGAELIVAGHIHQGAVAERREFEISSAGIERGVTVSIAPGLGQPRPNRRGEARGLHVYEFDDAHLRVHTYTWRADEWALTAERVFPRGREPLATA
jgi:3',5'-cyclic AMP phosphodiesterase CpdA